MAYQPLTRKQIADAYGVSGRTFKRWCLEAGIALGRSRVLSPALVQQIADRLGPLPRRYWAKD
jgi:hypothetical protein